MKIHNVSELGLDLYLHRGELLVREINDYGPNSDFFLERAREPRYYLGTFSDRLSREELGAEVGAAIVKLRSTHTPAPSTDPIAAARRVLLGEPDVPPPRAPSGDSSGSLDIPAEGSIPSGSIILPF